MKTSMQNSLKKNALLGIALEAEEECFAWDCFGSWRRMLCLWLFWKLDISERVWVGWGLVFFGVWVSWREFYTPNCFSNGWLHISECNFEFLSGKILPWSWFSQVSSSADKELNWNNYRNYIWTNMYVLAYYDICSEKDLVLYTRCWLIRSCLVIFHHSPNPTFVTWVSKLKKESNRKTVAYIQIPYPPLYALG